MESLKSQKRNIIVYIGAFELPDKNAAAHRVLSNAKLFQSLGYEVILVGRSRAEDIIDGEVRRVDYPDIEFECWETAYPKSTKAWFWQTVSADAVQQKFQARLKDRLFAVICYNYPAIAQLRLKWFANRMGGYGIADVTEWYARSTVIKLSTMVKNLDTSLRMRIVNFRMDALITTSRYLSRYYGASRSKIVELPTLIERGLGYEDIKPPATKDGAPKRLFFAGSGFDPKLINREAGGLKDRLDWVLELLFEVHSRKVDFRFEIYGVTRENYLAILPEHQQLVEAMTEKVQFHGRQPRDTLLKMLTASDFSIFLRKEMLVTLAGFPTKFSESITYGTPVITNMLENIQPYLVEEKNAIEIDPYDRTSAVDRLCEVLTFPSAKVLAMKNYSIMSDRFSYKPYREAVAELFSRLESES